MKNEVYLSFSGSIKLHPTKTTFICIDKCLNESFDITLEDYLKLSSDKRFRYAIKNAEQILQKVDEIEWETLTVMED